MSRGCGKIAPDSPHCSPTVDIGQREAAQDRGRRSERCIRERNWYWKLGFDSCCVVDLGGFSLDHFGYSMDKNLLSQVRWLFNCLKTMCTFLGLIHGSYKNSHRHSLLTCSFLKRVGIAPAKVIIRKSSNRSVRNFESFGGPTGKGLFFAASSSWHDEYTERI